MLPASRPVWRHFGRTRPAQLGLVLALLALDACDDGEESCRRSRTCLPKSGATGVEGSLSGSTGGHAETSSGGATAEAGMGGMGGMGGATPDPYATPPGEGTACSPDGVYACTGHSKRGQLVCVEGAFTTYGACRTTERCDTRPETEGLCQPMVAECFGHHGGDVVCRGPERLVCGIDLVTAESLGPCSGGCVDGACTECAPDAAPTCEFNSRRSCTAEGAWDVTACAAESPHCSGGECGPPPSCLHLDQTCGLDQDEACCTSPLVLGGKFDRNNDPDLRASISTFRLDRFEVTVGRFREFKAAWDNGWRPDGGSGKHVHLHGGLGLAGTTALPSFEPGWKEAYLADADPNDGNLVGPGGDPYATWTPAVSDHEQRPINFVTRTEAYVFCIWDGGFLPSDAEWSYAASGGDDQRSYPWGDAVPASNTHLAVYGCLFQASGTCTSAENIAPVGFAQGEGRFGQVDLVGNVNEWTLDQGVGGNCVDCAGALPPPIQGIALIRGGAFNDSAAELVSAVTNPSNLPVGRGRDGGIRCARSP